MQKIIIDDETFQMLHNYANQLSHILKHGMTFNEAIKHALKNLEELTNGDK